LFETGFALALKASEGFTKLLPSVLFAVSGLISLVLLSMALRHLPVGPAYAVWTGVGAAGTAVAGMLLLDESAALLKLLSIGLVLIGVVGLQLTSTAH
jgi:quaternary ammonium compound-resistance protein SugE